MCFARGFYDGGQWNVIEIFPGWMTFGWVVYEQYRIQCCYIFKIMWKFVKFCKTVNRIISQSWKIRNTKVYKLSCNIYNLCGNLTFLLNSLIYFAFRVYTNVANVLLAIFINFSFIHFFFFISCTYFYIHILLYKLVI